ncbi:hypothetical protein [Halomonas sp. PGE1]|uniref:hypothetical protein n=1 Tax=Halomonas sp. PGE1 TaxID=2730360 RepID=UPI0014734C82|nr:hypothetical protein [Halomonas sp. PGE1]QJQ98213.1 hypothetical protein HIR79_05605 [Halomonas sp. PGE1]
MAKLKAPPRQFEPQWLTALDGRTAVAQEMRRRFDEVSADLGGDLSYLTRSLVSRYLWQEFWIQTQEQALAEGQEVDIGRYTQAVNAASGLAAKLGLERKARDVPSLSDYLAAKGGSR